METDLRMAEEAKRALLQQSQTQMKNQEHLVSYSLTRTLMFKCISVMII